MTGLLVLDKPEGLTSFGAVARVRKLLQVKKAGHTGTLDPMATGVLPILLGNSTKLLNFLPDYGKKYLAGFRFGTRTDTLDRTGTILSQQSVCLRKIQIEQEIKNFLGNITQIPPMFSAKSQNGVRLYELARKGKLVERPGQEVIIFSFDLVKCPEQIDENTEVFVQIACSSGTYVRALIDDIGNNLQCGAMMTSLRRTVANQFLIENATTLEHLTRETAEVIPSEALISHFSEVMVTSAQAVRFRNGGSLSLERLPLNSYKNGEIFRVFDGTTLFALGKVKEDSMVVVLQL